MPEGQIVLSKKGFVVSKESPHTYLLSIDIQNPHISLREFMNFGLIQLIYDVNPDICQAYHLDKKDEEEATLCALMVHLFEDMGLPHHYTHMRITRTYDEVTHSATFRAQSINDARPSFVPESAEQLPLRDMTCVCVCAHPHVLSVNCSLVFEERRMALPSVVENMVGLVSYKLFNRVKQWLETLKN